MKVKQVETTNNLSQIIIWRMLLFCAITFCAVSVFIVIAFPDHVLDLLFYFSYMTIACTFLPLPTPEIAMDYGQMFDPILTAILGAIGFCISALIDYSLVAFVFRYEKISRIKTTRTYRYIERFFNKYAFVTLVIAAFTPIPVDPVKLVACASRYNRIKYVLACFAGRAPRYYLLGKLQRDLLKIPRIYLYGSIVVIVMEEVIRRLLKRSRINKE